MKLKPPITLVHLKYSLKNAPKTQQQVWQVYNHISKVLLPPTNSKLVEFKIPRVAFFGAMKFKDYVKFTVLSENGSSNTIYDQSTIDKTTLNIDQMPQYSKVNDEIGTMKLVSSEASTINYPTPINSRDNAIQS